MKPFEDYYEILQVHYLAESEIIEAAYKKLAQKYHPDINKSQAAAEKMKRINIAHDVLSDSEQRKRYDFEWLQRRKSDSSPNIASVSGKPKPIIEPAHIQFQKVKPGEVKRASFLIINAGGPYSKIKISNPDSWLKIVDWHSISTTDELPLKVNLEAQAKEWCKSYSENVYVKLDEVSTHLTVTLQTRIKLKVRDYRWHDMEFEDLKGWVKRNKDRLDMGEEFKGKHFVYRLNRNTGKYQIRLRHAYKSAIYDPFR